MDVFTFFRDVAFPVAVSGYLLIVTTRKLEALRNEIIKVNIRLALILDKLGEDPLTLEVKE